MAGLKRKETSSTSTHKAGVTPKKQKIATVIKNNKAKPPVATDLDESDTTEDENDFDGLSSDAGVAVQNNGSESDVESAGGVATSGKPKTNGNTSAHDGDKKFKVTTTSAEAHAAQRAMAKERKAGKPNADSIQRSKKIWERLRRKSHVPLDERKALVAELFEIITGRVRDFVFKHDSVRVIQCALKYANMQQRRNIVKELQSDLRPLAESKYGKFLVGKMIVEGDQEVRDMVIPEFYGHVRRLINHPEAAWIMDDIYRQVASPTQKALLLREWYGAEYAVFGKTKGAAQSADEEITSDLGKILTKNPEKRKPVMQYVQQLINQLVQKKMTGFTMLHDAMLQYFLNTTPGSEEATEFLELLKFDLDEEAGGDLLKNMAFTKSGSRVVCLALAYGTAKDRKVILRVYKDTIEMMSFDAHAYMVLLAGLDVTDDTKMSSKSIFSELLGEGIKEDSAREDRLLGLLTHLTARLPIMYPLAGPAKWLLNDDQKALLSEIHTVRETTSKKNAETRRAELLTYLSPPLLSLIASRAVDLSSSSFGTQCISEILLESSGDKSAACVAVADLADGDPAEETHIAHNPASGKMLRTLVQGGRFDAATKKIVPVTPGLGFADVLYGVIEKHVLQWATGPSSFVIVALVESADFDAKKKEKLLKVLKKGRKELEAAAAQGSGPGDKKEAKKSKAKKAKNAAEEGEGEGNEAKKSKSEGRSNAGARILVQRLDE